ncbi:hypothetical protein [Actinomadura bangladeshensis]|uniref:Uncharacterized protein n=1 Tax=Actinomadura bangladeshensis TaxID=453573 RepID=A0A6L9QE88_9ACTN|nr:hypothetical protein [Actinomadura bangladeshensis]NEA23807.1 hypothetical protein [Actinomadura bangladeshensis]
MTAVSDNALPDPLSDREQRVLGEVGLEFAGRLIPDARNDLDGRDELAGEHLPDWSGRLVLDQFPWETQGDTGPRSAAEGVRSGLSTLEVALRHRAFTVIAWLLEQGVLVENSLRAAR